MVNRERKFKEKEVVRENVISRDEKGKMGNIRKVEYTQRIVSKVFILSVMKLFFKSESKIIDFS